MANLFEELMRQNQQVTDASMSKSYDLAKKVTESKRKIRCNHIRLESRGILEAEDADIDEIDAQFAVDPDEAEEDEDEVVLVIDPEAPADEEVPEGAAQDLVGDYVYKCPVCGANYVCACDAAETEAIEVDEEGVPTECPICGDDSDQILIGEIAPVEDAGEETEMEPVDADDAEDIEETEEEIEEESVKKPQSRRIRRERRKSQEVKESLGSDVAKYQEWVDYDMKHYGKISEKTMGLIKKAGLSVTKDQYGEYEVISKDADRDVKEGCDSDKKEKRPSRKSKKVVRESRDRRSSASSSDTEVIYYALLNAIPSDKVADSNYEEALDFLPGTAGTYGDQDPNAYIQVDDDFIDIFGYTTDEFPNPEIDIETDDPEILNIVRDTLHNLSLEDNWRIVINGRIINESKESPRRRRVKEDVEDDDFEVTSALDLVEPEVGSDAPAVKIDADTVNLTIDDKRFESLMTKVIRENYKSNPLFKVTKVSTRKGSSKLRIEYVVRKGKKNLKGMMIAEGFKRDARIMKLKVRDRGVFTESFAKTPSFIIECVKLRNKIIPNKITYDYKVKVNESLYRVTGEATHNK